MKAHLLLTRRFRTFLLVAFALSLQFINPLQLSAQTPGLIIKPASGTVLDPDGDGYVSQKTNGVQIGFTIPPDNDVSQSEIPYVALVRPDIIGDLFRGPTGGFTEIVGVDAAGNNAILTYNDGANLMYRFRLDGYAPNSKSYSILIDTDGLFGFTGTNRDLNAIAGNAGFEVEICLQTNFEVVAYNVDGRTSGLEITTASYETNCQKSIAVSITSGDADYFYDFFLPFASLTGYLSSGTPVRYAAVTVMNPNPAIGNNALSDIGGAGNTGSFDDIFTDLINSQTPTPPGQEVLDRSACPSINGPIYSYSTSITGGSTEAVGTVIKVYKNGVLLVPSTTVNSGGTWTYTVSGLVAGDIITATATATGEGESLANCNPRTVLAGPTPCNVPAPIIFDVQAGKVAKINYSTSGNILTIFDASNNSIWGGSNNGLTTTSNSLTTYDIGTPSGISLPTNWYVVASNGSCQSVKVFYCSSGTSSTVPSITSPVYAGSTSIIGSCGNAQVATVIVFKNGVSQGTATLTGTGTSWQKTGLTLATNDVLFVTSKEGSLCMAGSPSVTVQCTTPSTTPTINEDVYAGDTQLSGTCGSGVAVTVYKDGVSIGAATVSGTTWTKTITPPFVANTTTFYVEATELNKCPATSSTVTVHAVPLPYITGTYCGSVTSVSGFITAQSGTIELYKEQGVTDLLLGSYTLTSTGAWTISGFTALTGGDQIYAKVTLPRGSTAISATLTISGKTANTAVISTDPILEGATTISGTGTTDDVIKLYIGGAPTTYSATVISGNWTISGIASFEMYLGASVYVTATAGTQCESDPSASKTVQCVPPVTPAYTGGSKSYCLGSPGSLSLTTSESGVIYQLVNSSGVAQGPSAVGTGSSITLYTNVLNADLTGLLVKAYKLLNPSCFITSSTAINFDTESPSPTVTFTSTTLSVARTTTTLNFPYTAKSSSPSADNYTIDYSVAANTQLFLDVPATTIPATPIVLAIPAAAAAGTYTGTITISSTSGSTCSTNYGFSVTVFVAASPPVISAQPNNTTICSGTTASLSVTAANATGYQWQSSSFSGGHSLT